MIEAELIEEFADMTPTLDTGEYARNIDSDSEKGSELVAQSPSSQLPATAEYYDSLEVDLDDTNSVGFGGLPTSAVSTKPQGSLVRLWRAVGRVARSLINAPLAWLKKIK